MLPGQRQFLPAAFLALVLSLALRHGPPLPKPLREWHAAGRFFNFGGHAVFFRDEPPTTPGLESVEQADTLLLLHGFPTSSYDWRLVLPELRARFRVVAPDLLGFGASDKADLVGALMLSLGVKKYHVLAHDYGDTVLQELLARALERDDEGHTGGAIQSAVMLNGGIVPSAHRVLLAQTALAAMPAAAALVPDAIATGAIRKTFAVQQADEEIDAMLAVIAHKGGRAVSGLQLAYIAERKTHEGRWVGALRSTATPLRFVCGLADPISGSHMADAFEAEMVDGADIVRLEGVGHWPSIEAPEAVADAVRRFHRQLLKGR